MIVSGPVGNPESSQVHKRSPKASYKAKFKLQIPGLVPVDYESGHILKIKKFTNSHTSVSFCLSAEPLKY